MKFLENLKEKVKGCTAAIPPPEIVAFFQYLNRIHGLSEKHIKTLDDLLEFGKAGWPEPDNTMYMEPVESIKVKLQAPLMLLVASFRFVFKAPIKVICVQMAWILEEAGGIFPKPNNPYHVAVNALTEIIRILKEVGECPK